ncbi:ABC transporter permease [Porphyromonas macacae]|uniref:ABC transporter permease n=1 Tax=Porphyromonas macacae TaxID=28115 RepID=A0A0A2G7W8_9PORP|nr:ABC transporter permease [Porphyromonas macacae]KGN73399.1 ABC transporter permease [Porphyromonas macacae]KGN99336.1 ABC transporter permease [Porphyromonas macacae]SUB77477.1 Probable phospholipid ABC transporter permease protein mlaE [Porphyromonas macacae]SUB88078.1 Probable phospholipid ABC transporter permease protein mlaE [Porphyromonas macacae]
MIKRYLETLGNYTTLMLRAVDKPIKIRMFAKQLILEIIKLGVNSLPIVLIISFFIGSVITIQLSINMTNPLIPSFTIGFTAREIILLEFSSTIMCLILAGKVGSSVASELGTMRVTEQIDAMEIMGINSAHFLMAPRITAFMLFIPVLSIFSMFIGILGGYLACLFIPSVPPDSYIYGIQLFFKPAFVGHSITKSLVYAFIISSVAAYYGYTVKGGALQVGNASTKAVVNSSVLILFFDLILTNLLLG